MFEKFCYCHVIKPFLTQFYTRFRIFGILYYLHVPYSNIFRYCVLILLFVFNSYWMRYCTIGLRGDAVNLYGIITLSDLFNIQWQFKIQTNGVTHTLTICNPIDLYTTCVRWNFVYILSPNKLYLNLLQFAS